MPRTTLPVSDRAAHSARLMFSNVRWWAHRLSYWRTTTQGVALVAATLAVSILLLTGLHVRSRMLAAYEERSAFAVRQSENIERLVGEADGDLSDPETVARVQHMTEDIRNTGNLIAFFFVDKDGHILAHSSKAAVGNYYRNPDMLKTLSGGKVVAEREEEGGGSRYDVAVPVRYRGEIVGAVEGQFSLESLAYQIGAAQREGLLSALIVALIMIPTAAIVFARFQAVLERMAITDGLSGLFDHRYFRLKLDEEVKRSGRYGRELALVLFDIDGFKDYNDKFGHLTGDEAIQLIAQTVKASIREVDTPARYGGEEFAIILPETSADEAYLVAERVRKAVNGHFESGSKPGPLTASFGVATCPSDARSGEDLIRCADAALYSAKLSGKNCSCAFSSIASQDQLNRVSDAGQGLCC